MNRKILLVLLAVSLLVSLVAFAACGGEEEAPPVTEEWQWPERLLLVTSRTTSPSYGAMVGWSTPLAQDTGMTIRIVCEDSSQVQNRWVKEGRFLFRSPHQRRDSFYGEKGSAERDVGPWQSRIIFPTGIIYWSFAVLGDSGIKVPQDIKPGMAGRITTLSAAPQQSMYALIAWAGINYEDIEWVVGAGSGQGSQWLMDGKIDFDVAYLTSSSWFEVSASPHGLGIIELDYENDPEGAQRFLDVYPWTSWGVARGQLPEGDGLKMVESLSPAVSREDYDPEFVYQLVKWMDENYDRYKDSHPLTRDMTMDNLVKLATDHYEPLHDGTVRYLEEIGRWTTELEARRQYNIEQMTLWVDAYQKAIEMADDKGIDVDPTNDEWQEYWENYRDSLELPLLKQFQGPGVEQISHKDFYYNWERIKAH